MAEPNAGLPAAAVTGGTATGNVVGLAPGDTGFKATGSSGATSPVGPLPGTTKPMRSTTTST